MPKKSKNRLFSGKQRKAALKEKRRRKKEKNINQELPYPSNTHINSNELILVKSFGGIVNSDKSGPIPSIFQKEPKEMVEKRRISGSNPIDLTKRLVELKSSIPCDLLSDPCLYHPIRPKWSSSIDKTTHESLEQNYFNEWRKQVQICFKDTQNSITPFENNLDVWRQLWRTIEQSDVILLIVDIRNPLLHIPPSLVDDVVNNHNKKLIVVLTKVDLVSKSFTQKWVKNLKIIFPQIDSFLPFTKQPLDDDSIDLSKGGVASRKRRLKKKPKKDNSKVQTMVNNIITACTKDYVLDKTPEDEVAGVKREAIVTIGCVGHPNVGKSSVLNSIIGYKVLSVSRTAGHTKHLQHIFLDNPYGVCVMDCPGLIFPMKQPRYILELCGLYPVAQIRETMSAIHFLAEHVELERLYVLKLPDWYEDEDGKGQWSALAICESLGDKRGYTLSRGGGAPDVHRAGLEIIRDCVDGIVCLCFHP
jgi:ribosome biogenesis GTPase A